MPLQVLVLFGRTCLERVGMGRLLLDYASANRSKFRWPLLVRHGRFFENRIRDRGLAIFWSRSVLRRTPVPCRGLSWFHGS